MKHTRKRGRARAVPDAGLPALISLAEVVLDAVSEGMALAIRMSPRRRSSFEGVRAISRLLFQRLDVKKTRSTGRNEHIVRGLFAYGQARVAKTLRERPAEYERPRLTDLILMHCQEASNQNDDAKGANLLIPSPLLVAIEAITVPGDLHTRAYALLAYRTILSRSLNVWPDVSFSKERPKDGKFIAEADIVEEISQIRTFVEHGDNRSVRSSNLKQFVSHFLGAKGVFYLRLKRGEVGRFLRARAFSGERSRKRIPVPEFRLSDRYRELPEAAGFTNEILGVPIPLRGAETVFFNGLKPSTEGNLVVEVSGRPGTGKTSFCLALAASFAPIDTYTLYLSFDEEEGDLLVKLKSQSQPRLRRLSFSHRKDFRWFAPRRLPNLDLTQFESEILGDLKRKLAPVGTARAAALDDRRIVPPLPLMVVIDSMAALVVEDDTAGAEDAEGSRSPARLRQRLIHFIRACQELGALVILVTSAESKVSETLDYLVDMALTLRVTDGDDHTKKPMRLLTLSKSRHQMARHGTHVFHLSGESGFRLSPQLPSQIDAQHARKHLLWDRETSIEVLNVSRPVDKRSYQYREVLPLPVRSHILIHGRGSTGKAGLALKCALAPRFTHGRFDRRRSGPRVLIVSFLYPEAYYEDLRKRIVGRFVKEQSALARRGFDEEAAGEFASALPKPGLVHFAPGFLSEEDLYTKIVRELDGARLEGRPYTDVIVDGLHNLGLQFPGARDTDVLWPIVYSTLSRADVTTITTFTTLELSKRDPAGWTSSEDVQFRLRTHLPLMHALVQASDYVIELGRTWRSDFCTASFQSAIDREPPKETLLWHRGELEFVTGLDLAVAVSEAGY